MNKGNKVVTTTPNLNRTAIMAARTAAYNLLDDDVRVAFRNGLDIHSDYLTPLIATTSTVEGLYSNVLFQEKDLIHRLVPTSDIVAITCNYGRYYHESYTPDDHIKKMTRKKPVKRVRKIQGDGTCFNSQITFVVLGPKKLVIQPGGSKTITQRQYKFKVFRTGSMQLPGVLQHEVDDVIEAAHKVADHLTFHLYSATNYDKKVELLSISPVMKNYKFKIKLDAVYAHLHKDTIPTKNIASIPMTSYLLDLDLMRDVINQDKAAQMQKKGDKAWPNIFDVKYTREETKLSAKFLTPIPDKPHKTTRLNIFMRGKINLLGSNYDSDITAIYNYLSSILHRNPAIVINIDDLD